VNCDDCVINGKYVVQLRCVDLSARITLRRTVRPHNDQPMDLPYDTLI
jgi:hypothetical protein